MYTNPKCWGFHPSMPSGQGFLPWGSTFNLRVRLQSAGLLPLLTALPTIHHHHCLMPDTNHNCCKRFFCSHSPLPTSDTESQISWWILVTFMSNIQMNIGDIMKIKISRWILVIFFGESNIERCCFEYKYWWVKKSRDEYWWYSLVSQLSSCIEDCTVGGMEEHGRAPPRPRAPTSLPATPPPTPPASSHECIGTSHGKGYLVPTIEISNHSITKTTSTAVTYHLMTLSSPFHKITSPIICHNCQCSEHSNSNTTQTTSRSFLRKENRNNTVLPL